MKKSKKNNTKPIQCQEVENQCIICFQEVGKKTGLQCQGACKKWAHYICLNYTPGKIQDIKAGYIKILCPCPDCDVDPKEATVQSKLKANFTCTNKVCPANQLPVCISQDCPTNLGPPNKPCPNCSFTKQPKPPVPPPMPSPFQESKCPQSSTNKPTSIRPRIGMEPSGENQGFNELSGADMRHSLRGSVNSQGSCGSQPCPQTCPSASLSIRPIRHKRVQMKEQKKKYECCGKKSNSISCTCLGSFRSSHDSEADVCDTTMPATTSDSDVFAMNADPQSLMNAVHQLCKTVGELSCLVKRMCKITNN